MKRPTRNLTGLRWSIDTNIIILNECENLYRLYELGWISLETPDTVEFELSKIDDPQIRAKRFEQRANFAMPLGPAVLDQSRLGLSVMGSKEDESRLKNIHGLIWGSSTCDLDFSACFTSTKSQHRLRDSMIVSTSIRYGISALITRDDKLLASSPRLKENYEFAVISPEYALSIAEAEVQRTRKVAHQLKDSRWYQDLPNWPS